MWARVLEGQPNNLSNKYQVDVCNLSSEVVKQLESFGVPIKNDEERGSYVTAKAIRPPKVMDASKRLWDDTVIGNGSTIKISAKPYDWTYKGKSGVSLGLNQLMVVNLVEYEMEELDAEEADTEDEVIEF
jgi:hypothetical protein|tara:strand:- start:779 stop:1168 length:390 start_codon:yes stop_codon:yes gene_type:complete